RYVQAHCLASEYVAPKWYPPLLRKRARRESTWCKIQTVRQHAAMPGFGIGILTSLLRAGNHGLSRKSTLRVASVHDGRSFPGVGCRHTLSKTIELILGIAGAKGRHPTVGRDRKVDLHAYGRETMEDPISPARRTLLKAGAVTLATPVAAAIAQPAAAPGHQ